MTRLSAHRRMFDTAITAQYITNQKSVQAVLRGDWAESDRQRGRCARWCDVADRLLGWVPTKPAADTAIIPRSEITSALALAQLQEAIHA